MEYVFLGNPALQSTASVTWKTKRFISFFQLDADHAARSAAPESQVSLCICRKTCCLSPARKRMQAPVALATTFSYPFVLLAKMATPLLRYFNILFIAVSPRLRMTGESDTAFRDVPRSTPFLGEPAEQDQNGINPE